MKNKNNKVKISGKATADGWFEYWDGYGEIKIHVKTEETSKQLEKRLNNAINIVYNDGFNYKMELVEKTLNKLDKQTNGLLRELGLYDKLQKVEKENTHLRHIIEYVMQEMSRGTVDQNELMVYIKNEMRDKPDKIVVTSECEK